MKEGKVWNIAYEMENILFTDPNAMEGFKMLGVDFNSDKFAHKVWFRGWSLVRFELNCSGETKCSKVWRDNGKVGFIEHEKQDLLWNQTILYDRVVEEDMSTAKAWSEKAEKGQVSTEEIFKLPPWALNTIVVRLNSGGLMLFAPVKIQEEMAEWLAERGTVEWVVLPRLGPIML